MIQRILQSSERLSDGAGSDHEDIIRRIALHDLFEVDISFFRVGDRFLHLLNIYLLIGLTEFFTFIISLAENHIISHNSDGFPVRE